ncbi:MAG TPA: hypothetical protein VL523_09565 [Terriglobia bacterium]|nr:hypothetical protein [Terriglobia bacterium]
MTRSFRLILWVLVTIGLSASIFWAGPPLRAQAQAPQSPGAEAQPAPAQPAAGSDAMAGMPGMTADAASTHPWCEDTAWSTFNHRVAGWFLLFWGLTALIAGLQWPRLTWWRYVPPMALFGLAEFLFFRNDPEAWPVGPMSFWASLHNAEDLQHRIFLLLVILIALVELLRAAGRLSRFMAKYALPALGCFGAIYLFFHKHGGAGMADLMHQAGQPGRAASPAVQQMLAAMSLVRHEHLWFSLFGFGLVAAKLAADTGHLKGRWGASLWSVFAIFLGVYMIGYVE